MTFKTIAWGLLAGMMLATNPAFASGALNARGGLFAGSYKFEDKFEDQQGGTTDETSDSTTTYGVLLGSTLALGRFFGDVGIEFSQLTEDDASDRTDLLLNLGMFLGDRWTVFLGYRQGRYGDGVFNDDALLQYGPVVGAGVSFFPGEKLSLNVSLAVSQLALEIGGQEVEDLDLTGASLKAQANFLGTPHGVFLRAQHFAGDISEPGFFAYEYTETYAIIGYQLAFTLSSW